MDREDLIRELFEQALELPAGEQSAFLSSHCSEDAVRERVQSLLRHHALTADFLTGSGAQGGQTAGAGLPFDRLGDFRLIREIGRGGMGIVYLGEEEDLHRAVAVKVLLPGLALSGHMLERFKHEARIMAKLNHEGIVPIYRFGLEKGVYYIATEHVPGNTLAQELLNAFKDNRVPSWGDRVGAAKLAAQVADALHHAHQNNVLHRDVKPSNILLNEKGSPRLTDFGLAKDLTEEALSHTGDLAGTYYYMSPEQAYAHRMKIDHRTDIFSLGVVLYEMLSGRRPFTGHSSQEILHAIAFDNPTSLQKLVHTPTNLDVIVSKALEKSPDDRYATAADFAADLRAFSEHRPIVARPPSLVERTRRFVSRRRLPFAVGTTLALALAIGVAAGHKLTSSSVTVPVEFNSSPSGATVFVQMLDFATGEPGVAGKPIGITPLNTKLAPGYYRFTMEIPGLGFTELSRRLKDEEHPVQVEAPLLATRRATVGMIAIEADSFIAGIGGLAVMYPRQSYWVPTFLADTYEVTNAEYREFLLASGHAEPPFWHDGYQTAWDKLPVVGVTWFDARTYAEWVGKRLPTRLEWDRMARGTVGHTYPWGDEPKSDAEVRLLSCVGRLSVDAAEQVDDWFATYLQSACPVGSHPEDVSPDGVFDVLGNVWEWVDTPVQRVDGEEFTFLEGQRCAKGGHWRRSPAHANLISVFEFPADVHLAKASVGFRCVKSATPVAQRSNLKKEKES